MSDELLIALMFVGLMICGCIWFIQAGNAIARSISNRSIQNIEEWDR